MNLAGNLMAGARDYSHRLRIFALLIIILTLLHMLFLPLHNLPFAFVEGAGGRLQSDIVYKISIFSLFQKYFRISFVFHGAAVVFVWGQPAIQKILVRSSDGAVCCCCFLEQETLYTHCSSLSPGQAGLLAMLNFLLIMLSSNAQKICLFS